MPPLHGCNYSRRKNEANKILQPALAYYREQRQAGAHGTQFRQNFAYALYVRAIAAPADAASQKQRRSDLDEAGKLIVGASAEKRRNWPACAMSRA